MNSDAPSIILLRSCHHHNFEAGEKSPARLQKLYIAFSVDKQTGHGDRGESKELIQGRQPMELSSQFAMLSAELGPVVVQIYLVYNATGCLSLWQRVILLSMREEGEETPLHVLRCSEGGT